MANASDCVVLVPFLGHIEVDCENALRVLEDRGYHVRRVAGYSAIDQARSQIATDALADGFEELMWIDSDIAFQPDDVERLRAHNLPVTCGIYPKKGPRELSCHVLPGTDKIVLGSGGGLLELKYAATGFLHTRRAVYQKIVEIEQLPTCNAAFSRPIVPYFLPLIVEHPKGGLWYLAEDYSFSERLRRANYKVMADTRIRLYHIGKYGYGWEEAGTTHTRYDTFHFNVT